MVIMVIIVVMIEEERRKVLTLAFKGWPLAAALRRAAATAAL
jgi:hypothetical protein